MKKRFLFLVVALNAGAVFSQWNTNPTVNNLVCSDAPLMTMTVEDSKAFQMVNDGSGGVFIAWRDARNYATTGFDIYVQHINAGGTATWTSNGLTVCNADYGQYRPHLVADGSGGVVITWDDLRDGGQYNVYAQHLDAAGNQLWGVNGKVICNATGTKQYPRVLRNENGHFTFVWRDSRNGDWQIFAQRVDASGNTLWTTNGVAVCSTPVDQYCIPRMISDNNNAVIICWEDVRNGAGINQRVYAQRLLMDGTVSWTADGIKLNDAYAGGSQIIADGNNGAIITFWSTAQISVQRIDQSGNLLWSTSGVQVHAGTLAYPAIATDGSNGCFITWYENKWTGSAYKYCVIVQRVNTAGNIVWDANGIQLSEDFFQYDYPQITSDGAGGAIICWANYDQGTGDTDIFSQRVSSTGAIQWLLGGKPVCTATRYQANPLIVSIGSANSVLAWVDDRNPGLVGIYSSRLLANGTLPVTNLNFYGTIESSAHLLFWTTEHEQYNRGFVIERSADGVNYQPIGFIAGQSNSTSLQRYNFTDANPLAGKNYYRLKQVDLDENYRYSKIILLNKEAVDRLNVFPNPASSIITIQSHTKNPIQILDAEGKNIRNIITAVNSTTIDVRKWPAGVYYVRSGNCVVSMIKTD